MKSYSYVLHVLSIRQGRLGAFASPTADLHYNAPEIQYAPLIWCVILGHVFWYFRNQTQRRRQLHLMYYQAQPQQVGESYQLNHSDVRVHVSTRFQAQMPLPLQNGQQNVISEFGDATHYFLRHCYLLSLRD